MTLPTYTPEALRGLLSRHHLTGSATARLLGVTSRSVRKWTAARDALNAADMPASAWWLLLLLTHELTVCDLLAHLETAGATDNMGPADSGD